MMHHSAKRQSQKVDVLIDQPCPFQDGVEYTGVVLVHPFPDHCNSYRTSNNGKIEDTTESGEHRSLKLINGRSYPQGESAYGRYADYNDDKGIFQRLKEGFILPKIYKICKTDEVYRAVTHIGVGETVEDADKHGDDDKTHKENEAGQHEQVAVDILPPL